jgi:murein DD-endopeptidase MepM/ murein hydrolase activator NlpD
VKPTKGGIVTFPYGAKYKTGGIHKGVDFRANKSSIYAAVGGTVVHAGKHAYKKGWGYAFGIHVIVANEAFSDGTAGFYAGYCHLSAVSVKVGQSVAKGDLVGISGNTGFTTAPHLHFQILSSRNWNAKNAKNPEKWLEA